MKAIKDINNNSLNEAIKALNGMVDADGNKLLEKPVRFIGVKKDARIEEFVKNYETFAQRDDAGDLEFPDASTDFYKDLFDDELEIPGEETGSEDADAEKVEPSTETPPEETESPPAGKKETPPDKAPQAPKDGGKKKPPAPKVSEVKLMVAKLIEAGKYTRKEVLDKVVKKYPAKAPATIRTYITDSLSEKYSEQYFGEGKRAQIDPETKAMSWM